MQQKKNIVKPNFVVIQLTNLSSIIYMSCVDDNTIFTLFLDVDECLIDDLCPQFSICRNEIGGYHCTCADGYEPAGTKGQRCKGMESKFIKNDNFC